MVNGEIKGVAHFIPVVSDESAVKTCVFSPTAKRESALLVLWNRSPLVVRGEVYVVGLLRMIQCVPSNTRSQKVSLSMSSASRAAFAPLTIFLIAVAPSDEPTFKVTAPVLLFAALNHILYPATKSSLPPADGVVDPV